MSDYFTVIYKLKPGEQAEAVMASGESIPGVKVCAMGWSHAFDERDCYQKDATDYRRVLNQIRDNPATRRKVEAVLGNVLDALDHD